MEFIRGFLQSRLSGYPGRYADLSVRVLHGVYMGFSPMAIIQGVPIEEARLNLLIEPDKLVISQRLKVDDDILAFRIAHTPKWLFHLTGWGVDNCLAVRQDVSSSLASCFFAFPPRLSLAKHDAAMFLGEGMFALLGLFYRPRHESRFWQAVNDCKAEMEPRQQEQPDAHLLPIGDYRLAKLAIEHSDVESACAIVDSAAHNLWTATPETIEKRMQLLKVALQSPHPKIQKKTLDAFAMGARVTNAVPALLQVLPHCLKSEDHEVFKAAVEAVSCLLYESANCLSDHVALKSLMDGKDFATLASSRCVTPEEFEIIKRVVRPVPRCRRWTASDVQALYSALADISRLPRYHETRGLKPYVDDSLKQYRHLAT